MLVPEAELQEEEAEGDVDEPWSVGALFGRQKSLSRRRKNRKAP